MSKASDLLKSSIWKQWNDQKPVLGMEVTIRKFVKLSRPCAQTLAGVTSSFKEEWKIIWEDSEEWRLKESQNWLGDEYHLPVDLRTWWWEMRPGMWETYNLLHKSSTRGTPTGGLKTICGWILDHCLSHISPPQLYLTKIFNVPYKCGLWDYFFVGIKQKSCFFFFKLRLCYNI